MSRLSKSDILMATAELRSGSVITENEINCLKRRWGRVQNASVHDEIEAFMAHGPYRVSDEQAAKGMAWWQKKCWTASGWRRDNQFTQSNAFAMMWEVLGTFDHFLLVDFELHAEGFAYGGTHYNIYPIYRMVATSGIGFNYVGKRVWGGDQRVII